MSTDSKEMITISEKQLFPNKVKIVEENKVDEAAPFGVIEGLDKEASSRICRKIDWHIMPLMFTLYCVQFIDKSTLGSSAIMGIKEDAHLTADQYNWLSAIFYFGYLVFQYPQNLALQKFPLAKWMSINVLIWSITLCANAACKSFASLLVLRFILGICEGCITPAFMLITAIFYTRQEQKIRVGYWYLADGVSSIITGFLSFGFQHIRTAEFHPWKWLMLFTGLSTIILAICIWIFFPDSPATASFLTLEEQNIAIERIKVNQTGIGNKKFKPEQVMEAFKDKKTWLFALFFCLKNIPNSISNQRSIIINSFGFSVVETLLLSYCVVGVISIVSVSAAAYLTTRFKHSLAYVAILFFLPHNIGCFLMIFLPWSNKIGLLLSLWTTSIGIGNYTVALSWVIAVSAGHTKRITANAIILCSYCVGNIIGPHLWQERFAPQYHLPWIVITVMGIACPLILLIIRIHLSKENEKRDAEREIIGNESVEEFYIKETLPDGSTTTRKVSKEFLDLTDKQNRDFRYVL